MTDERNRVCPVELANSLDSKIRRWLQNPQRILAPYVKEGMTVLDVGCGPGFFSVELAKLVGRTGKVISVDLQQGMLDRLRNKIKGTELEERITLVKCETDGLHVSAKVDFALAFYMVHEVPGKESLFKELKTLLREPGQILMVEPKLFHVSKEEFAQTTSTARKAGFVIHDGPRLPFSWSAILRNA
jgi:ubiquinone/menaquinone biosynthesis C-methylase UbiE